MSKVDVFPPRFRHRGLRGAEGGAGLGLGDYREGAEHSREANRIRVYWPGGSVATEYVNLFPCVL